MLAKLTKTLEGARALDPVVEPVQKAAVAATRPQAVKNLLSGTWLGHSAHPALIVVPLGTWISSFVLDLVGGEEGERGADRLLGIGVLSAVPAAATGLSDWSDAHEKAQLRVGLVHAGANYMSLGLQVASYVARRRGRRAKGKVLSGLALGISSFSAYLGGHMSYVQGVGVNHPTGTIRPGWRSARRLDDLVEGTPSGASVDGLDVVLVRRGADVASLAGACIHAGGPLADGTVEDGCIVCPWHGSRFDVDDGHVVRGPATTPQPTHATRILDGVIEVASR